MSILQEDVGGGFKQWTVSWENPLRTFGELTRIEVRLIRQPLIFESSAEDIIATVELNLTVSLEVPCNLLSILQMSL